MDASFCCKCKDKKCLPAGKPCQEVEKYLRKQGIKGRDWIRPRVSPMKAKDGKGKWREIPFTDLNFIDDITPST